MSFFSEATHQYPILSEGDTIQTLPFLLASQEIVPFFGKNQHCYIIYIKYFGQLLDVLGPTAFSPVKKDISGNIQVLEELISYNSFIIIVASS